MKIEIGGGYNIYRKNITGEKSAKTSTAAGSRKAAETDVSEISRGNTAIDGKGFGTLKAKLQSEINLPAAPERLEQLRTAVRNGSYRVPTEDLVNSILAD